MMLCDICKKEINELNAFRNCKYEDDRFEDEVILCKECNNYYNKLRYKALSKCWQLTKKKYGNETVTK